MKLLRSSSSSALLLVASTIVVALLATTTSTTSTFALLQSPLSNTKTAVSSSSSSSSVSNHRRTRRNRTRTALAASSRRDDSSSSSSIEDQVLSMRKSWNSDKSKNKNNESTTTTTNNNNNNNAYLSDIPTDDADAPSSTSSSFDANAFFSELKFKDKFKLPPPPEDQFIMTGDIAVLFLYAFTSHSINDAIVKGVLDNPYTTMKEAVQELDPMHDIVNLHQQYPVWVDLASNPNIPFGNPAVDRALEVSARESLLNHWGPLLSTEGSACVALCTCWLIAGWFHRAFRYDNSLYCGSQQALWKTVETWWTASMLLMVFAVGADLLLVSSSAGQLHAAAAAVTSSEMDMNMNMNMNMHNMMSLVTSSLTQSDVLFIIDSLTVLIAWRWSANRVLNTFR